MTYKIRYTTNKGEVRLLTLGRGLSYEKAKRYAAQLAGHKPNIKSVTVFPAL